jgi:hypothetical protein
MVRMDLVQNRDQVKGSYEYGNGFQKCCEILEWLHNWWPLEKLSAP